MRLRVVSLADAAGLAAIYAPYVRDTAISFEMVPPSDEELARRVASTVPRYPWLVAVEGDEVLGYAYGHPFADRAAYRWSVETSIYVHPERRSTGVGRILYPALLGVLEAQGYQEAFAGLTLPNEASVSLHEQMGFRRVAHYERAGWKSGAWHDTGWWQRRLRDDHEPPEPISVDELPRDVLAGLL